MIRRAGISAALIALLVVGVLATTVRAGNGDPSTVFLPIVQNCPALACDDFSNPASGWPTGPVPASGNPIATFAYTSDGTYQMLFQQPGYVVPADHNYLVADFQAEVDVWSASSSTSGTIGLNFDKGNLTGFYDFEIGQGYYFLAWYSTSTNHWTTLVDFTPSSAILPDNQHNRVKVVRQGSSISLYANNTLLKQVTDSTSLNGYVDLAAFANSTPFDARFDNFVLYALSPTPTSVTTVQTQTTGREVTAPVRRPKP
jgi:hypothetical protein